MQRQPVALGYNADRRHVVQRQGHAAAKIVGILRRDQPGNRIVLVVRANGRFDLGHIERTVGQVAQRPRMNAADSRRTALLEAEDVVLIAQDHLIAPPAVGKYSDQIPWCRWGRKPLPLFPATVRPAPSSRLTVGSSP